MIWAGFFLTCSRRAFDRVRGALIGARLTGFATLEAVCVLCGMPGAVRLAFTAELRTKLAEAGVLFRSADHRRRRGAANVRAVKAREHTLCGLGCRVADVFRRAFIAGHCAKHASLNGTLHILFSFVAHMGRFVVLVGKFAGGKKPRYPGFARPRWSE
jgi:hypothetical protein